MKLQVFFVLLVLVLVVSAKKPKEPRPSDEVVPQWTCDRLKLENTKADEAKANLTKCQYLQFIKNIFISQYTTPQYPQCYVQMDGKCADKIVDYYEKRNIRIFSTALTIHCETGGQWDDFITLLATFQTKFPTAYNTDYWNCVKDQAQDYSDKQYVPFPEFPAPFMDVLNYVCQGLEAGMRNAERIQFQQFFDDNGAFKKLSAVGQPLWGDFQQKVEAATLNEELKQCLTLEAQYFHSSTVPEVEGAYNTKENRGDNYEQAYLYIDETEQLSIPFNEDKEGYQCWNYYAPRKHYHVKKDVVAETDFDGNRGHPLCPPNTMYQPLSFYGPICCPIHPVDFEPRTYNCCFESLDLPQIRRRRPMRKNAACYGCTCLKGYEMDTEGDFFGLGDNYGACVKKEYEE